MKSIIEWPELESISHIALAILYFYILFAFITDPNTRTLQNILLFAMITAIDTLIHQNINNRNNKYPQYWS